VSEAAQPNREPASNADIIPLREQAAKEPGFPVEAFLLSPEALPAMARLYETIDGSNHIIRTLNIRIGEAVGDNHPSIYDLLLSEKGREGLTRSELIELYKTNPLINTTLRIANIRRHSGDLQAERLYMFGMQLFRNMVRYEWLTDVYEQRDQRWEARARRLGEFYGSEVHLNLQPGFDRNTKIPREHTPSNYLKRIL